MIGNSSNEIAFVDKMCIIGMVQDGVQASGILHSDMSKRNSTLSERSNIIHIKSYRLTFSATWLAISSKAFDRALFGSATTVGFPLSAS